MSDMSVDQILSQMRAMKAQMDASRPLEPGAGAAQGTQGVRPADQGDFSNLLKNAIDGVNETQKTSGDLTKAFEAGAPDVSLAEVMVAKQKASLSFTAMSQVRNKVVEAYKEIMNMPV